ncbi:MAG: hypothetical protein A3C70_02040 [Candidatus Zambryskibacteria bacterium RIFCSPHIGHO2_02_FULL_43_14]|uniref:Uncharacterized protein n=1 Tax=Candidatus Zambryskibacteria bacterium RIFCSPHIGHO2_02_FULL_43_14 TaxID=1802748 RepID=A0A1G2THI4_9BACT|nr:MAG: hypothetical protein A2829_01625 [Candidatus Zambryskibacteria bacterium RIFCSPHIGHO2_01_FULL_43_60]OHA96662.1 MAG: hypothetical protein A3C70_02040 [Candidatus Zambryskibacteria bacterium RIFCSPHIGHO2_02_FULL_43_14]OHB03995.1 MAG: hypothetical protein A3B03_00865 [Candidatus Zambryskibacteria bacterium RIFCSPLOWO2_01_FULL_42_41]
MRSKKCCKCKEKEGKRFNLCEDCQIVVLEEFRIQIDSKPTKESTPKPEHGLKLRLEGELEGEK